MFRFDKYTFKYDRYIVVLTKRAANEDLKVNNANENFLPSFHSFLLRSSGFKCNFIDFFSQDTLRYITKWKAGKMNQSLLHAKANKFSRNALIDSKPPAVTAHNHAFKSPFTIMSKFYHNAQRIAFFQPQISQVAFLEPAIPAARPQI